jgi:hypothetical protein
MVQEPGAGPSLKTMQQRTDVVMAQPCPVPSPAQPAITPNSVRPVEHGMLCAVPFVDARMGTANCA